VPCPSAVDEPGVEHRDRPRAGRLGVGYIHGQLADRLRRGVAAEALGAGDQHVVVRQRVRCEPAPVAEQGGLLLVRDVQQREPEPVGRGDALVVAVEARGVARLIGARSAEPLAELLLLAVARVLPQTLVADHLPGPAQGHRAAVFAAHSVDCDDVAAADLLVPSGVVLPGHRASCLVRGSAMVAFDQTREGNAMDLGAVVRAANQGDRDAWNALVARYSGLIWSVARAHRLGDADAADVVQATWLRLVEHLGEIRDAERVGAWLATTARRECLRVLRVGQRHVLTDGFDLPDEAAGAALDARMLAGERDAALWRAFGRISVRCRALLRMLAADPAPSYEEVGAALDMPIGSIGPTRGRCLDQLRERAAAVGIAAGDA
jgi:RNA polymerase sigma factor (sigma-70 family)